MRFQPVRQINTILKQEYFESTISWAFRVVLALNVPLIVLPLWKGFSAEVIWAAFAAYLLSLIDYRGSHYRKIIIQSIETVLIILAAFVGIYVANSLWLSIIGMFIVGIFAALIRNWSDYGSSIGVAVCFFFLFGLANPIPIEESPSYMLYIFAGSAWAILITLISFPFKPSNPVRRSVAKIWKSNTDFLDALIQKYASDKGMDALTLTQKELDIRTSINHSMDLFSRRKAGSTSLKAAHYDMMMDLRKTSSFFGASLNVMHEELEVLNDKTFQPIRNSVLYKTLSSLAQASARIAIVVFTLRAEDITLAKIRVKRFGIAINLFAEASHALTLTEKEKQSLHHFIETLYKALGYLEQIIQQIEEKLNLKKSDYLENYKLSLHNFLSGLKPDALMEFFREIFNINSQQFKYALRVAIGLCMGVFIFKFFKIDHGHWIALTIIIVIQPYYGATRKKGIERIIGTVAGIVLGGVVMLLPLPHNAFVGILVVISFFVAYFLRNNYKVGVFFVTIMMVVMMQMSMQATWQLIGWRVLSTLIGAALALLASYVFWPVWENQRFPALMSNALLQNKNYLQQIISYFSQTSSPHEPWHKNRRVAEAANNDVFACVQRMYEEPQHIQKQVDVSFAKVGVSIRITREITSIGLVIDELKQVNPVHELTDYFQKVGGIFDWIIQDFSTGANTAPIPDFTTVKESLNNPVFSTTEQLQFIQTELEKVTFELETCCELIRQQKQGMV